MARDSAHDGQDAGVGDVAARRHELLGHHALARKGIGISPRGRDGRRRGSTAGEARQPPGQHECQSPHVLRLISRTWFGHPGVSRLMPGGECACRTRGLSLAACPTTARLAPGSPPLPFTGRRQTNPRLAHNHPSTRGCARRSAAPAPETTQAAHEIRAA